MAKETIAIGECEAEISRGSVTLRGGELWIDRDGEGRYSIYFDFEELEELYLAALLSRDP